MVKLANFLPVAASLFVLSGPSHAAQVRSDQAARLPQRLFPALATLGALPQTADHATSDMLAARRDRISACGHMGGCVLKAAIWSEQESDLLAAAAEHASAGRSPDRAAAPDDGVRGEVVRELKGLNDIIQVYGLGSAPRYPAIDGPALAPDTAEFRRYVKDAVALSDRLKATCAQAVDPSVDLALALVEAAKREDATAFEPLDTRYNASAMARARTVGWPRFRYSAIIVPGVGPNDLSTPLSAGGKLHVRLAAAQYFAGMAPFILVSGGTVHPRGTKHVEAFEMRRALIERYHVPAAAIVVEPYARHTTTNLRNAVRRLVALGAPLDKRALIVTDPQQSQYIEGPVFSARNKAELGYQPGAIGSRLSPTELTFEPAAVSLRTDPADPLDP